MTQRDREIDAFFASLTAAGAQAKAFPFAVIEEAHTRIIEVTYTVTGISRWYDLSVPGWSKKALKDFDDGKFDH
ncbi:MAG TPA: hypothetical protein VIG52_00080 [Methyloceanibacter sp.]